MNDCPICGNPADKTNSHLIPWFLIKNVVTHRGQGMRDTEVSFTISSTDLKDIVLAVNQFWPDAGKLHFDSYREVTHVDDCKVSIVPHRDISSPYKLFFINLVATSKMSSRNFIIK